MCDEIYLCSACGASFSTLFNLKKHVRAKHPSHLDELPSQRKIQSEFYVCHVCTRKFRHKRNLRRHIQWEHKPVHIKIEVDSELDEITVADHNYMDVGPVVKVETVGKRSREDAEEPDFICRGCGGVFSTLFNLRKHVRCKHPGMLDTFAPRRKIGKFACLECGRKFSHYKSLGRHRIDKHKTASPELKECPDCGKSFLNLTNFHKHVKNKHPDSVTTLVLKGIKEGEFTCDFCGRVFTQRKNLRRHMLDKHKETSAYTGKPVAIYQCPLCSFSKSGDVSIIMKHFETTHNIQVPANLREFDSKEEFLAWKEEMEKSTKSSYVKKAHVGSTSYYRCHRSGKYRPRGNGIRSLKMQGSNKIGGFCPAGMQVRICDGKYTVRYSDTHVGHTNDLKHLKLTRRERHSLAAEIASKVSLDDILNNARKVKEEEVERVSLITKQDLTNIMRQYQLEGTAVRRSQQADSLDTWLLQAQQNVLYYKPQACPDPDHPYLEPADFILIIMTKSQAEMLTKFGEGCICLDRTDMSASRFHLSSIMVVDDSVSAFPTSFLVSSRVDTEILEFFFSIVRAAVGVLTTNLLLTDVAEHYYTAWIRVMNEPVQTAFCLWQVEGDWQDNLAETTTDETSLTDTYLFLHSLMSESVPDVFNVKLKQASTSLSSVPDTSTFGFYFTKNYTENFRFWSKAYRSEEALAVDSTLERLHYALKYLYTEVKRNQRLDRTIDSIIQFIDNKFFERVTNLEKSTNKKIKNIVSSHKSSLFLNIKNIIEVNGSYFVLQLDKKNSDYRIDEVNPHCDCELKCDMCNVCVHKFNCTCPESILKQNMCKHIHLVCQFIGTNGCDMEGAEMGGLETDYIDEVVIMDSEDTMDPTMFKTEVTEILTDETPSSHDVVLNQKKIMIASLSNEIIHSINSVDEGDAFIQILKAAKPTVAAIRDDHEKTVYISTDTSEVGYEVPVKRVLYTAPYTEYSNSEAHSANSIEAHITLDADGITLVSQATNFANAD